MGTRTSVHDGRGRVTTLGRKRLDGSESIRGTLSAKVQALADAAELYFTRLQLAQFMGFLCT